MARVSKYVVATVLALVLWFGAAYQTGYAGWWHRDLAPAGDAAAFHAAVVKKVKRRWLKGNAAFTLLEDGEVVGSHFDSLGDPVTEDTLFQIASLSKWISAWGVMILVEQGLLELDAPVSTYLTRWSLPISDFDNDGVTVRRLLSHTAGLDDGLGYLGFSPDADVQSLEASLTLAEDAMNGRDGRVHVGHEPGTNMTYSGGGFTVLQLLVEEVTGESFATWMKNNVLDPVGMTNSSFVVNGSNQDSVADFYGLNRRLAMHRRFTALAAASLYSSVSDLRQFLTAHLRGPDGTLPGRGALTAEAIEKMRAPQIQTGGSWGLGVKLYAETDNGDSIIGHDGLNAPAISSTARMDPDTGDGIIILQTGSPLLAQAIGGEWVYWKTGKADRMELLFSDLKTVVIMIATGWVSILSAAIIAFRRGRTSPA